MTVSAAQGTESMGQGILHAATASTRFTLSRQLPPPGLAPFVDFYWIVRWDLRGQPPHDQRILPHPNVNLAFEAAGAAVFGVDRSIFTRRLSEQGKVLGVRFRAGGFRPFWGKSVAELNDRVVAAREIFGPAVDETCALVMSAETDDDAMAAAAEGLLRGLRPAPDPLAERIAGMVEQITADPELRRVADLSAVFGMSERRLQRLFAEYVGVSPKWVMRRARLLEAARRAEEGTGIDWAALAAGLGYADQAHLTRDFTATLGVPPTRYAATVGG